MKDIGEAIYIFKFKIHRNHLRKFLTLSQEPYIKKILEKFNIVYCKLMDPLIVKGQTLNLNMCFKTP